MKSFPSAFTKDPLVNSGLASGNIKQTLKNIAGSVMNNILSGGTDTVSSREELGERFKWEEYSFENSLKMVNFTENDDIAGTPNESTKLNIQTQYRALYENANKIPAVVLGSINKYRTVFNKSAINIIGSTGGDSKDSKTGATKNKFYSQYYEMGVSPSLFNPWFGISVQGATINTPLLYPLKDDYLDERHASVQFEKPGDDGSNGEIEFTEKKIDLATQDPDFTDCSIRTLVNLSNNKDSNGDPIDIKFALGRAQYKYADFMFCKDLGKVSNNHLITLRKFTHPIGDNIFKDGYNKNGELLMDVGRLVTWFGTEDNDLSNICQYQYRGTWRKLESKIEDINSQEDNNPGMLSSLVNVMNKDYNSEFLKGNTGGGNMFYNWIGGWFGGKVFQSEGNSVSNDATTRAYMDENKVWTPLNTIQETYQYEGKIQFEHQFDLTFTYKLRAYDGINPKSAFLDLLGNILEVTGRHGTFWGGKRRWLGAPRNQQGWDKMNKMFAKVENGAENFADEMFEALGDGTFGDWLASVCESAGTMINGMVEQAKEVVTGTTVKDVATVAGKAVKKGMKAGFAMLKNKLGRPAIYAINSILSGAPVGLWHVTIGNPRNPIFSMGNLILTNAQISHSGPLGIDDFPTELKVKVTLTHGQPRDVSGIENMYTCGQGDILLPLNGRRPSDYYDLHKGSTSNFSRGETEERYNQEMIRTVWGHLGR